VKFGRIRPGTFVGRERVELGERARGGDFAGLSRSNVESLPLEALNIGPERW